MGETEGTHPSYQAWSYAALLKGFNEAVNSSEMDLRPCAYLHNHPPNGAIDRPFYKDHIDRAPLFLQGDAERERLRKVIAQHVKYGDSGKVIEQVEGGRIQPSKALAGSLRRMLAGNQEFILIDDQKVVFESVCFAASSSSETRKKSRHYRGWSWNREIRCRDQSTRRTHETRIAQQIRFQERCTTSSLPIELNRNASAE